MDDPTLLFGSFHTMTFFLPSVAPPRTPQMRPIPIHYGPASFSCQRIPRPRRATITSEPLDSNVKALLDELRRLRRDDVDTIDKFRAKGVATETEWAVEEIRIVRELLLSGYDKDVEYECTDDALEDYHDALQCLLEEGKRHEDAMKSKGLTIETMTIDDWVSHVFKFVPLVLDLVETFTIASFSDFKEELVAGKRGDEVEAEKEFRVLMDHIISESGFDIYEAFWTLHFAVANDFTCLPSVMSYLGLLLLFEWIIIRLNTTESPEDMKTMVKKSIEEGQLFHALKDEIGSGFSTDALWSWLFGDKGLIR